MKHRALILVGLMLVQGAALPGWSAENTPADSTLTPYQKALLQYKSGHYEEARTAITAAESAKPGDPATELLKARILTELGDFPGAEAAIKPIAGENATPEVLIVFGDLYLRKGNSAKASTIYEQVLKVKPADPDILLKIVYARIGAGDLTTAEKVASQLKPFDPTTDPLDPKHPGNPAYYFAKAALAQSTGKSAAAEDDIQTARTLYGITTANRYLKTYLEVIAAPDKGPAAKLAVPPSAKTNAAPSGR